MKNTTRYPPITEDVYSRFNDDGWGIRNVRRTKRSKELLDKIREERRSENIQREKGGSEK